MVRKWGQNLTNSPPLRGFLLRSCGTVRAVLGQAHTPRRRFLPFAIVALIVLAAPALGLAGSTTSASKQSASSLQHENAQLAAKSRAAVLELYSLDAQLGAAQSRLTTLDRQAAALRTERAEIAQQVGIARRGSRMAQQSLAEQLRLLYEQGNVEPLEIVFGAKSLDEALTSLDNLSRVSGQSDAVLRELKTARIHLRAASGRLASREAALARATSAARATAAALAQTRAARNAYIGSLTAKRRLNDGQIASVLARSSAAAARTAQLARSTPAASTALASFDSTAPAPSAAPALPAAGGQTITVSATGYALSGTTATGLPVGWGIVAVDPSVIPLGTHMTIPGYGEAVAADTGGAIVGSTIDLWFPTTGQALAWGRRTVTVVLH
jgi:3D (Asp-Asp-Asp) domain-containing protein